MGVIRSNALSIVLTVADVLWVKGQRCPLEERVQEYAKTGWEPESWLEPRFLNVRNSETGIVERRCGDGGHRVLLLEELFGRDTEFEAKLITPDVVYSESEAMLVVEKWNKSKQRNLSGSQADQLTAKAKLAKGDIDVEKLSKAMADGNIVARLNKNVSAERLSELGLTQVGDSFGALPSDALIQVDFASINAIYKKYGGAAVTTVGQALCRLLPTAEEPGAEPSIPKSLFMAMCEISTESPKLLDLSTPTSRRTSETFLKNLSQVMHLQTGDATGAGLNKKLKRMVDTSFNNHNQISTLEKMIREYRSVFGDSLKDHITGLSKHCKAYRKIRS